MKSISFRTLLQFSLAASALAILSGCAATTPIMTMGPVQALSDGDQLVPVPGYPGVLLFVDEEVDFTRYDRILLEPVEVLEQDVKPSTITPISKEEEEMIAEFFRTTFIDALDEDYEFVTSGTYRTMKARIVITEVDDSEPLLDTMTTVAPSGFLLSNVKRATLGTHSFVGHVTMEGELTDARTGKRLVAVIASRAGGKSLENKLDRWKDAKASAIYFAERVRVRLSEFREGQFPERE